MNDTATTPHETDIQNTHSLISRLLHMGMAVGVSLQLLLSTGMERPRPAVMRSTLESLTFSLHEYLGLMSLALILAWLWWLVRRRDEPTLGTLFPWVEHDGRNALMTSVVITSRQARHGKLAETAEMEPLVKTVHGLGLVCISVMAFSGTLVWLGMDADGAMPIWTRLLLEIHQLTANFVWAFIFGHAGMAVLHQLRGDETLARMFSLRD
jgi:cytochrome b561